MRFGFADTQRGVRAVFNRFGLEANSGEAGDQNDQAEETDEDDQSDFDKAFHEAKD